LTQYLVQNWENRQIHEIPPLELTISSNRSNISVGISSENKVHVGEGGISVGTSGLSFLWAVDVAEGIEIVGCNKVVDVVDIILEGK
jgi:hypothetical protein